MDILRTTGISKSFGEVQALKDVDFSLEAGEIHALMGENGAGKSTLVKIITGVYQPTNGSIWFDGADGRLNSPQEAEQIGISTVYQEVNLLPDLSVTENICLGREPRKFGFINWKAAKERARKALAKLEVDIDVSANLASYSIAIQQLVAIARSLDVECKLLILDEPTSSLDENETHQLFQIMRHLRDQGLAIIFITHFLDQVYEVCDRITILRDGCKVGTFRACDLPRVEMVSKMIGKSAEEIDSMGHRDFSSSEQALGPVILKAENLESRGVVGPLNFELHAGSQVGLAGLLGSGRTETANLLFGIASHDAGHLEINGKVANKSTWNPRKAVKARLALIAEDRKLTGVIPDLTVRENIILALQASKGALNQIPRRQQDQIAEEYIRRLDIKTPSPEQLLKNLSGGNQQKVLIARWLATKPELIILDEPTRGIDIGAKAEIEALTDDLCKAGMSVVFISSELEEIVQDCQRVVVLRDRRQVGELAGTDVTMKNILKMIAG